MVRTIEDIKLSRNDEGETVIDGHDTYLSYRIRGDVEAKPITEFDVWIEMSCPCCSGTGHLSVSCDWGCDHEIECSSCEGNGWLKINFEKGFDEDEDKFVIADAYDWFSDAELTIPFIVRSRFYYNCPIEDRDDCGHYIDPNQTSLDIPHP